MNMAEKIAATYLRLNGFLLLPQFTVFIGGDHGHVDLVGLRAKGSKEESAGLTFPIDDKFFDSIDLLVCENPLDEFLGLVGEVKTNRRIDQPKDQQVTYVRPFLGNVPIVPVAFSEGSKEPRWEDECLHVGNAYALEWVFERASWMNGNVQALTKTGSWNLSEDALSEILVLGRALGRIREKPAARPE
jgi:hypothetical protein